MNRKIYHSLFLILVVLRKSSLKLKEITFSYNTCQYSNESIGFKVTTANKALLLCSKSCEGICYRRKNTFIISENRLILIFEIYIEQVSFALNY